MADEAFYEAIKERNGGFTPRLSGNHRKTDGSSDARESHIIVGIFIHGVSVDILAGESKKDMGGIDGRVGGTILGNGKGHRGLVGDGIIDHPIRKGRDFGLGIRYRQPKL